MPVLAFDCAAGQCAAALLLDDGRVHARVHACQRGQAELLIPMITDLLAEASFGFQDIGRIAVTTGPGSFTGVRVGLSAAQGLGLALDIPVIGIDSFTVFAAASPAPESDDIARLIVIESRRREVYWRMAGGGRPAGCDTPEVIVSLLPQGAILVGGDGADHLANLRHDLIVSPQVPGPDAAILARLARAEAYPSHMPAPYYIRPPDAKPAAGP